MMSRWGSHSLCFYVDRFVWNHFELTSDTTVTIHQHVSNELACVFEWVFCLSLVELEKTKLYNSWQRDITGFQTRLIGINEACAFFFLIDLMTIPFALRACKVNVRCLPLATTMPMQMHLLSIHVSIHMCPGRKWTLGTYKQRSPIFRWFSMTHLPSKVWLEKNNDRFTGTTHDEGRPWQRDLWYDGLWKIL